MPANLNPQYFSAEERYRKAKDDRERIKSLKEMLAVIPKHKGTEKLQADIKRKLSRLKEDMQYKKSKGPKRFSYDIEKEGAGQIAVVGPPNSGKSQLVNSLAKVNFEVADYSFTTRMFQPAMMPFEDIQIQLIDLPPFSKEYMENWLPSIVKKCDAMLLVFDLSRDDLLNQVETTLHLLKHYKIEIENIEEQEETYSTYLKSIFIGNKMDRPKSKENIQIFIEYYGSRFSILPVSVKDKITTQNLKKQIIKILNIVRIYSKRPRHEPDYDNPFILSKGKTLLDFTQIVHKDFTKKLKFARIWSRNRFNGQRVTKDYILEDKDVIEMHI